MTERKQYSEEMKASVMAALLTGQSVSSVAKEYKIPEGTIKGWKSRQKNEAVAKVVTQKKEKIGELLIAYLTTSLETLRMQSAMFSDRSWLKRQDASSVAVLHGVLADKTIRLLEALSTEEKATE